MTFINDNFMLRTETARALYTNYAQNCPIIDYHCHLDPKDIAEDVSFKNITQLWLKGDHYKWRLMRAAGIEEKYITGDATDSEKFMKWASVIEKAVGNPLYHWCSLELKRYFNIDEPLTVNNAGKIWDTTSQMLSSGYMTAKNFIRVSNVKLLCTTDDPLDNLSWHKKIAEDKSFDTTVLPTFRPDKFLEIESKEYTTYLNELSELTSINIKSFSDLLNALSLRLDFFAENGCMLADHGMEQFNYLSYTDNEINVILGKKKTFSENSISASDVIKYKSALLNFFSREYKKRGWVMQLHFGAMRNLNGKMKDELGANIGCDSITGNYDFVKPLSAFFSNLQSTDELPRVICYSLNPNDDIIIDTLVGCFRNIQHGAAWWFNDNNLGIRSHIETLMSQSYLPEFVGMLTDSRSFLSYTRHEYFRRILCDILGSYVEDGLYPDNRELLGSIIEDICYKNAAVLFGIE